MGWFRKEAKAFGREFGRQGSILLFGKVPKSRPRKRRWQNSGSNRQYRMAQNWAKKRGYR